MEYRLEVAFQMDKHLAILRGNSENIIDVQKNKHSIVLLNIVSSILIHWIELSLCVINYRMNFIGINIMGTKKLRRTVPRAFT